MSRHRAVRSMNYSDEYEGFDDVYGHSVEDDYCVSPSEARFLFDRSRNTQISAFIDKEDDIAEENEEAGGEAAEQAAFQKPKLSDLEEDKLKFCVDEVQNVIGDTLPLAAIEEVVIKHGFDVKKSLNAILDHKEATQQPNIAEPKPQRERKPGRDKDETQEISLFFKNKNENTIFGGGGDSLQIRTKKFIIPKLKTDKMEKIEKSVEDLRISEQEENSFSSLKSLIEGHKKSEFEEDLQKESSGRTLAEFSQNFLTSKLGSDVRLLSTDEKPKKFVIPKLTPKNDDSPENWVIDLTSALKSGVEFTQTQPFSEAFRGKIESDLVPLKVKPDVIRDSFLEFNVMEVESNLNTKRCSPFGKILCRKWRSSRPKILVHETVLPQRIVRFDFATPSPDDLILKYLRRK